MSAFTEVNGFIRNNRLRPSFGSSSINTRTNFINNLFGEKIKRFIELRAVTSKSKMPLAEVTIDGNNEI